MITGERVIIKVDTNLYFPGVEKFRQAINDALYGETKYQSPFLLVDLSSVKDIDYTALKVIDIFL